VLFPPLCWGGVFLTRCAFCAQPPPLFSWSTSALQTVLQRAEHFARHTVSREPAVTPFFLPSTILPLLFSHGGGASRRFFFLLGPSLFLPSSHGRFYRCLFQHRGYFTLPGKVPPLAPSVLLFTSGEHTSMGFFFRAQTRDAMPFFLFERGTIPFLLQPTRKLLFSSPLCERSARPSFFFFASGEQQSLLFGQRAWRRHAFLFFRTSVTPSPLFFLVERYLGDPSLGRCGRSFFFPGGTSASSFWKAIGLTFSSGSLFLLTLFFFFYLVGMARIFAFFPSFFSGQSRLSFLC